MFAEDKKNKSASQPRQPSTDELGKEINLLPEKMRGWEKKHVRPSGPSSQVEYTQPPELSPDKSQSGGKLIAWFKGLSSRWRQRAVKPLVPEKPVAPRAVSSPATPLQKLYTQVSQPELKKPVADNLDVKSPPVASSQAAAPPKPKSTGRPMSMLEKIDEQLQRGIHIKNEEDKGESQFGVNLIPEELVADVNPKRIVTVLSLTAILTILFIGLGYLVIDLIQLNEAKKIKFLQVEKQRAQEEFIAKSADLTALVDYKNLYDNIKTLLSQHLYWTQLLQWLEDSVTTRVYYEDVIADKNGLVTISANAEDYIALAEQYLVFKQSPVVFDIAVGNASLDAAGVVFDETAFTSLLSGLASATTTTTTVSSRQLISEVYQALPVRAQFLIRLSPALFYKTSTTTAQIVK